VPSLPPPPPPGTRLGPYEILERIGVGGMAEVFRAREPRDVGEPRLVVLKRMLPAIAARPRAEETFAEEARLGAGISHRNVVQVLDQGREDGQPYLVLEYIRGVDLWRLNRWLTREGRVLEAGLSMFIVRELLAGLDAVHSARHPSGENLGIVHRDVSPSNLLLSIHGDVKLGDFGIARAQLRQNNPQAETGERAKGKLGYLAPEQITGSPTDARSDLFSAAVVAAELLMGKPLFVGGSELAILLAVRDARVEPFVTLAATLPGGLGAAVLAGLSREPARRVRDAASFRASLERYQDAPDAVMREQLGELVRRVCAADGVGDEGRNSLTPTAEHTPVETYGSDRPTPVTSDVPVLEFSVQLEVGGARGPWNFAQLVEAVATGRVGPNDRVSRAGGAFLRVQDIPEIGRHLPSPALTPATREAPGPTEPTARYTLEDAGFVQALASLVLVGETGLLLCEQGGARKEVYLADGVPEFVSSNLAGELLGEFLVGRGLLTRGELDMALAVMPRFEGRLGDTLVALGLVDPVHLFQHIAGQVREKLIDLFLWSSGEAAFYRGVPPPSSGFPLGLDPWQIVDEGIGRRLSQGLEEERFRSRLLSTLERNPHVPSAVARGRLPDDAAAVFAALARPCSFPELSDLAIDSAQNDPTRVTRAVLLLLALEAVRWVDD